ncbi:MAG TPA: lipopolysaccharide biosynthesis protein [Planctomycetota bacterium]|nr:lipopolysaccharide biosynthesis protein [Planctomycetota bacterium]
MRQAPEFGSLKRRVVSGVFVTGAAQVMRQVVQLGAVAVLARLLGPGPYGLVALATVVVGLLQLLVDLGLGATAVREGGLTSQQESTLLRLNLGAALAVGLAVQVAAPWIAALLRERELAWVLRGISPGFLLAGALQTRRAVLQRAMRFRLLAAIELLSVASGAAVAIALALLGTGDASLVIGSAAQQGTWCLAVLLAAGLPPRAPLNLASVRPLLGFGGHVTAFSVVNYVSRTLDNALVGSLMGRDALGLYEKAYALMMLPITQISAVISQVMFPALSAVREDRERFRFLYLGAIRKVAGLAAPLSALCVVASGPVVRLLLGPRFVGAIPIFSVLSLVMGLQALLSSTGWLYMAGGRMRLMLRMGVFNTAVVCAAIIAGALQGTPLAVARWYAGSVALLFLPTILIALRACGIPVRLFFGRVGPPAVSAIAACLVIAALPSLPVPGRLLLTAGTYCAVHAAIDWRALLDLFRFLDPRRALGI